MESPEKIGIDKLSLIITNDNSVMVAMNAPTIIVVTLSSKLNKSPIMQQVTKHAIEPDKVLRPILIKG